MSVLIRGMEMPKNCGECERWCICKCVADFDDFESICNAVEDGDLVRDENCPLIEVPPHGRLIDADELKENITEEAINLRMNGLKGTPRSTENQRWAIARLDEAPTIIEAEGSAE